MEWGGWHVINRFIPYTEEEVDAPGRFESYFLSDWISDHKADFSPEAVAVLDEGRKLWRLYFSDMDEKKVRDEFRITNSSVGWYQVRKCLEKRYGSDVFGDFKVAYSELTSKLRKQVYEFGMLR